MLHLFDTYPAAAPVTPPSGAFTYQSPAYLSIIDGIGGFGMDTGAGFRPATGGAPNWYLITSTGTSTTLPAPVDTRTYECTLPAALAHNVNNKVIINLTSGVFNFTSTEMDLRGDNVSMIGFACRADYGAYIRSRYPLSARGSHLLIWGWRFMQDKSAGEPNYELRDNVTLGWNPVTGPHIVANCEFYGGIDESLAFYDSSGYCSSVQNVIGNPMEGAYEQSHNYGTIIGASVVKYSEQRNAYFHCAGRVPLSTAEYTAIANNLVYNPSDGRFNNSQCIQINRNPGYPSVPHYAAVGKSLVLNGPQGYANNWPITAQQQVSGTQIYATGMRQRGFAQVTSAEATYLGTQPNFDARQWRVTSPPAGCMPGAWGTSMENIDDITDSTAGMLAYIDKLESVCGVQPKNAGPSLARDLFDQARAYVNQSGSGYGAVVQDLTYPSLTSFTIDPTNGTHVSTYWDGNSMPSVGTRDSLIGGAGTRTYGEEWVRQLYLKDYGP